MLLRSLGNEVAEHVVLILRKLSVRYTLSNEELVLGKNSLGISGDLHEFEGLKLQGHLYQYKSCMKISFRIRLQMYIVTYSLIFNYFCPHGSIRFLETLQSRQPVQG